jgi:non-heme chloroperoxidase
LTPSAAKNPGLWAAAALGLGLVSMGVNLVGRRQQQRWQANPDPLDGRVPNFPVGQTAVVEVDDGAHIHTVRSGGGGGRPGPVVLVHGLTSNLHDWGPVAERLVAQGVEVIGVDLRGHGRSTMGRERYTPVRLAADLAQVLESLDVTGAVLAGHSMGGMAALALAVHHPELLGGPVTALALLSTAAQLGSARFRVTIPVGAQLPGSLAHALHDTTAALGVVALSAFGPQPSLFMLHQAVESFNRCPDATRRAATAGLIGFDVLDGLGAITVPTLVLSGTHDLIVPFVHSGVIASAIPGARLVALAGAGHLIPWERPDEVATHLIELQQRAAGSASAKPAG